MLKKCELSNALDSMQEEALSEGSDSDSTNNKSDGCGKGFLEF
jgi:hypothetical protein